MFRTIILALCLCLPLLSFTGKQKKKAKQSTETATPVALPYSAGGLGKGQPADPEKPDFMTVGSYLPPIRVVSLEGREINNKTLANDANLIVMFFNPTCEHCEDMTAALEKSIGLFNKSHIVLVAGPMMGPYLDAFQRGLKTAQYPRLQIGLDSAQFIDKAFNYEGLPQLNVYGPDRKLIKVLNGITTIDSLKAYIQ